jgi:hypothetical protein
MAEAQCHFTRRKQTDCLSWFLRRSMPFLPNSPMVVTEPSTRKILTANWARVMPLHVRPATGQEYAKWLTAKQDASALVFLIDNTTPTPIRRENDPLHVRRLAMKHARYGRRCVANGASFLIGPSRFQNGRSGKNPGRRFEASTGAGRPGNTGGTPECSRPPQTQNGALRAVPRCVLSLWPKGNVSWH